MAQDFPTVKLNPAERKFIANYCPQDRAFTSIDEMESITRNLGLKSRDYKDLCALRNTVVVYFSDRMEQEQDKDVTMNRWIPAMQSITAVIDNIKLKKYGGY